MEGSLVLKRHPHYRQRITTRPRSTRESGVVRVEWLHAGMQLLRVSALNRCASDHFFPPPLTVVPIVIS